MQDAEYPPSVGERHLDFWRECRVGASEEERQRLRSFVYVIQGEPNTPIKVGVAVDPPARLRGLQTGNWQTLRLLHVIPGGHALEAAFHRRLRGARLLGEWFGGPESEEFLAWVADYCQRAVDRFVEKRELPAAPRPIRSRPTTSNWRLTSGEETPITVRFVKPDPPTEVQKAERERLYHEGAYRLPAWAHRALTPSQSLDNYGRRGPR